MSLPYRNMGFRLRRRGGNLTGVTDLVAVVNVDRSITLTWVDSAGATDYTIQEDGVTVGSVGQGVQTYLVPAP